MVDLVFSKGDFTENVYSDEVNEEYSNKLIILSIPRNSPTQETGKKDTKILDLLRITHQFVIKGYVTAESGKTAKVVKDNLRTIANGAGINGGTISMTYDGDTYNGYMEKIVFTKKAKDSPSTESTSEIKYELAITFVIGTTTA